MERTRRIPLHEGRHSGLLRCSLIRRRTRVLSAPLATTRRMSGRAPVIANNASLAIADRLPHSATEVPDGHHLSFL